jgi:hypothetical protein
VKTQQKCLRQHCAAKYAHVSGTSGVPITVLRRKSRIIDKRTMKLTALYRNERDAQTKAILFSLLPELVTTSRRPATQTVSSSAPPTHTIRKVTYKRLSLVDNTEYSNYEGL